MIKKDLLSSESEPIPFIERLSRPFKISDYILQHFFSIVLDAKVSIVTVSKLVDVAVTGNCKC